MKSRTRALLILLMAIAVFGAVELYYGPTVFRQLRNMRIAREHLPVIQQKIGPYPEFKKISVFVYTDAGGSIVVDGYLRTEIEANRLHQIIDSTKPPVPVVYNCQVITDEADRLIIWPTNLSTTNSPSS